MTNQFFRQDEFGKTRPTAKGIVYATLIALTGFLALLTLFESFTTVGAGERGVIVHLGAVQDRILDEGFHITAPYVQSIKTMDVTIQKAVREVGASSKDLQDVYMTLALNYHLDPTKANYVYQQFKKSYEPLLIDPTIEESVKSSSAQFTAEQLVTLRTEVSDEILVVLRERLSVYGIIVDELSIMDFSFSDSFDAAIEAKVTAEQEALKAKNDLLRIQTEAEQRIAEARGEAEAIRIQAGAITQQGGEDYVKLKWVEKWNGTLPTTMLGEGASVLLGL